MKKTLILFTAAIGIILWACSSNNENMSSGYAGGDITKEVISTIADSISVKAPNIDKVLILKGIDQAAAQWSLENGSVDEFKEFCYNNFELNAYKKRILFNKLSTAFEILNGANGRISVELKKPLHLEGDSLTNLDYILGGYDASAHLKDDLYKNKTAFITILNFPFYTLKEKDSLASSWNRLDWAYARMGDIFTPQPPAAVKQKIADAELLAESYISEYNIYMGNVMSEKGERLFPSDMKLLTHWNLRDEIKSNYSPLPNNIEKQELIYQIMLRIIDQSIPKKVINNNKFDWFPITNRVKEDGDEIIVDSEANRRYEVLLEQFRAQRLADKYYKNYPNAISRAFDGQMQISVEDVEALFIKLMTSSQVKDLAKIVKQRLGRDLKPYDIWYDGFKSRSSMSQLSLDQTTKKMFPNPQAFKQQLPTILKKLGFSQERADWLSNAIVVEAARGSGHAWGAADKSDVSRLRTRIPTNGMDYKGFNIAVHELGHNVEQTISMRNADFYMLNGIPNTAFTEANAFVFQKRDLQILGINSNSKDSESENEMDIVWGAYEIMGVALTDIEVWRWMYANEFATPQELKVAVISIATDIWNKYYAPVFGVKDSPILAIYSHMINYPLYLANYPMGHIIEYQLEKYYKGKNLADEIFRIYSIGNLTPKEWMIQAVGKPISVDPMIDKFRPEAYGWKSEEW